MNPKLKQTVKFFPVEGNLYHVYDASTAKHFKLGAQEVSWLRMLDGSASMESMRGRIPLEYFDAFFAAIHRLGVLDGAASKKPFSLLKLKLINIDPSGILQRLQGFAAFYREFLAWASVPLLMLNVLVLAGLWPRIQQVTANLDVGFELVPFYFLFIVIAGVVHELSHALVARSYGVSVPHVGGMLMFFHPAFYADISGINMLSDRKSRLRVLFAGVQSNNLLIALGLLLCTLPVGARGFELLLFFATVNFVLILVNLIPFIEYDGYFIFQELIGEPRFARNANVNVLSKADKRAEYFLYAVISQLFQFSLIASIVFALRMGVLQLWQSAIVDIAFLCLLAIAYPALAYYRVKKMG